MTGCSRGQINVAMSVSCAYFGMFQFSSVPCKAFLFLAIAAGGLHAMGAVSLGVKEGMDERRPSSFAGCSQAGIYMICKLRSDYLQHYRIHEKIIEVGRSFGNSEWTLSDLHKPALRSNLRGSFRRVTRVSAKI